MALDKFNPNRMSDEHLLPATLLELGDTLNFIETRKHSLRNAIKDSKVDAGVGKVSGLGAIAGGCGLLVLSNPLGSLVVAGGAVCYGMAVFAQWLQTGKFQPMPLSSKTQADRDAELAGSTETGNAYDIAAVESARSSIREDAAYLSDREKVEYELLHFSPEGLLSAMNHVHPTQRWSCYQFLIDAFLAGTIQSYFANPQSLRDVLGNPNVYTSHLPEASKRFPQYGLQSAGAISGDEARSTFQPARVPPASPVGNHTRLNAVETRATSVSDWQDRPKAESINIARFIAENIYSYVLIGASGSGKGFLLSHIIRQIKAVLPHITIVLLDPKNDPREAGYWDGIVDYWHRCNFLDMAADQKSEWIRSGISLYQQVRGAKLLILDEATAQFTHMQSDRALLQEMKSFVTGIGSSGNSRENYMILAGHTANLGDYGISGGAMSSFRKVYIARNDNTEVIKQLGRTSFTGSQFGEDKVKEICAIANQSEVGRAVYLGTSDKWYSLAKLENYSGYDRDSRTFVDGVPKVTQREKLDRLIETETTHPIEQFYHSDQVIPDGTETDDDELAIRAEIKRFLLANSDGSKPRDLSARARKPVKGMSTDDVKFVLDVMALDGEIYEVDGTFFANS